jgi:SAM-dependent methyltransferase
MSDDMIGTVKDFFEAKIRAHGATPQGLDYSTSERQQITFKQLTKIWEDPGEASTLLDYGCGYGALIDFMDGKGYQIPKYVGYDISPGMLEEAERLYGERPGCSFTSNYEALEPMDYVIAGGVFNLKFEASNADWLGYVFGQIEKLWGLSNKGFAFNILTKYSDFDRMRPDLYYADPTLFFDYCKQRFSRKVALLHDYEAYEFTILIRR